MIHHVPGKSWISGNWNSSQSGWQWKSRISGYWAREAGLGWARLLGLLGQAARQLLGLGQAAGLGQPRQAGGQVESWIA